jgi:glycosyltransferase involved in cell wall biosynthesis
MGLHFERAATRAPRVLKPVYRAESLRCRRREHLLASRAEIVTAVSDRDLEALSVPAERGRVVPVSGREIVPTDPKPATPTALLSGNLGYRPTVEAARWFGEQVWHRILDRTPGARWLLVGARPNRTVRRLARLPGVEVHADVGDLAPYMAQAHVAIAPMESGSGAPMKVIEAWSAGVPVVVGRWAAAGLDPAGVAAVEVASTPDEWVTTLHRLLTEPESAARLGRLGREVWESHYRFDRIAAAVRDVVADAVKMKR